MARRTAVELENTRLRASRAYSVAASGCRVCCVTAEAKKTVQAVRSLSLCSCTNGARRVGSGTVSIAVRADGTSSAVLSSRYARRDGTSLLGQRTIVEQLGAWKCAESWELERKVVCASVGVEHGAKASRKRRGAAQSAAVHGQTFAVFAKLHLEPLYLRSQ